MKISPAATIGEDPISALLPLVEVRVTQANTSNLGIWWSSRNGRMPAGRIYLIDRGTATVKHHGQTFTMTPGHLYLIPAHTDVVYYCEEYAVCYWCHFRAELHGRIDLFSCLDCEYVATLPDPEAVRGQLEALQQIGNSRAPGRRFAAAGILLQLLARFLEHAELATGTGASRDFRRLQPALAYISEHLAEAIRVEDLAQQVHLETTYFAKVFASVFGVPPTRYLIQRRVEAAQRRLWHTDLTIAQIGRETGFCDGFHFSKTFKRLTGVSPTEFRRRRRMVP